MSTSSLTKQQNVSCFYWNSRTNPLTQIPMRLTTARQWTRQSIGSEIASPESLFLLSVGVWRLQVDHTDSSKITVAFFKDFHALKRRINWPKRDSIGFLVNRTNWRNVKQPPKNLFPKTRIYVQRCLSFLRMRLKVGNNIFSVVLESRLI